MIYSEGNIYQEILESSAVIGVNSTVLLEACLLGKPVYSFGKHIYTGNNIVHELTLTDEFPAKFSSKTTGDKFESFFWDLVFNRQISLDKLKSKSTSHLLSCHPFNEWHIKYGLWCYNGMSGLAEKNQIMLTCGKSKVNKSVHFDISNEGSIEIGDGCEIRHNAVFEVLGSYNGKIKIGNRCVVGVGNWFQGAGNITLEDNVILGPYVCVISSTHTIDNPEIFISQLPLIPRPVYIEEGVWIGAHCIIACGVTKGRNSIVGANSFVNKDVPPNSIVAGTPAKEIKRRNP